MNNPNKIVVFGVIFQMAIFYFSCDNSKDNNSINIQYAATQKSVLELVSKHKAITDWNSNFNDYLRLISMYTIELESILVRTDDRPIFFYGKLYDIKKDESKYKATFHIWVDVRTMGLFQFELECNETQMNQLMETRNHDIIKSLINGYAVIARINGVRKISTAPDADVPMYLALGRCMDFLYIENLLDYLLAIKYLTNPTI